MSGTQALWPPKRHRDEVTNMPTRRESMSPEEVLALARTTTTTGIPTASRALGFGVNLGYDLAKRDEFPCRVLRVGRNLVGPTADLVRALGLDLE